MKIKLGRTGIMVNKDGFGALPIQRRTLDDAVEIVQMAVENGINFIDTARMYTDSEAKLGKALQGKRASITLATKTTATTPELFKRDLATSLAELDTHYIDIYQFHNYQYCPAPGDGTGMYEAMLNAKKEGEIHFIGLTSHKLHVAMQAAQSGLYDTIQYPFNYLATEDEFELVRYCEEHNIGYIAMKALSGGLLNDIETCRAFMMQYKGVVPIWGIQKKEELRQLLDAAKTNSQTLTAQQQQRIEDDRQALCGEFCRSCGYCLPCPVGIQINEAARMRQLLRRMPTQLYLTEEWQAKMEKVTECIECGQCAAKCPYGLDTPALLKKNYLDYQTFLP